MNLKFCILTVFLFVTFINVQLRAQTPEELINELYSDKAWEVLSAIDAIQYLEIYEALPAINELFDSQPPFLQLSFLNASLTLNDPQVESKALDVISRADSFANYDSPFSYDPLEAKVEATFVLLHTQNYSTVNYIFDIIKRDGIRKINVTAFVSLEIILDNVPSAENEAKDILVRIWDNSEDDSDRYFSMCALVEKYGAKMIDRVLISFIEDAYLPIRVVALEYLFDFNYSELDSLIKSRLALEPEWSFRTDIADSLLFRFGEPSDLKTVIDYQPNEPNETARSLMGFSIDEFIPPKPDSSDYNELCEKLISYTDELFQYGWIQNEETQDYYEQRLVEVNNSITSSGDINEACSIISSQIIPRAEQDLKDQIITEEGYKFLHYYTIYINEEFEKEFGPCP